MRVSKDLYWRLHWYNPGSWRFLVADMIWLFNLLWFNWFIRPSFLIRLLNDHHEDHHHVSKKYIVGGCTLPHTEGKIPSAPCYQMCRGNVLITSGKFVMLTSVGFHHFTRRGPSGAQAVWPKHDVMIKRPSGSLKAFFVFEIPRHCFFNCPDFL